MFRRRPRRPCWFCPRRRRRCPPRRPSAASSCATATPPRERFLCASRRAGTSTPTSPIWPHSSAGREVTLARPYPTPRPASDPASCAAALDDLGPSQSSRCRDARSPAGATLPSSLIERARAWPLPRHGAGARTPSSLVQRTSNGCAGPASCDDRSARAKQKCAPVRSARSSLVRSKAWDSGDGMLASRPRADAAPIGRLTLWR
jgi:hypothetical protein